MLYLLGLNRWSKRTIPSIHEAIAYFKQAVDSAPSYAQAHAGMALALAVLPNYEAKPGSDTIFAHAEREARLALKLDSTSDEAWAALSQIYQYQDHMREAEQYARKAIALNDNNATAHQWLAEVLFQVGRLTDALAEINRAIGIDPLSPVIVSERGLAARSMGNYNAALKSDKAALAFDSLFNIGSVMIDAVEAKQWDFAHQMLVRLTAPDHKEWVADTIINGLRNPAARPSLTRLLHAPAPGHEPTIVWLAEKMGDRDLAIALARADDRANIPSFAFWTVMSLPSMKALREDPRFPARFKWPRY
jgi:tetratricopeptide (TPR) repeat protein